MTLRVYIPRDAARCRSAPMRSRRHSRRRPDARHRRSTSFAPARAGSIGSSRWSKSRRRIGRVAYGPVDGERRSGAARRDASDGGRTRCGSAWPDDIPWLKRQTRLTFARCGVVDPLLARRLPRAWRLQGPRARAVARRRRDRRRGRAIRTCAAAAARASRPASSGAPWRRRTPPQKYIVCNADEGDSGTFADRMIMEGDPFVLIEGMAIAGIAIGATKGYIYIRSEYPHAIAAMEAAIAMARARRPARREDRAARATPSTSKSAPAPAPMSAARKPRCSKASKASAASCAPSRRCRRTRACSASRP